MPAPNSSASAGPGHQRSRLSRQVAQEPDEDEDAEGEEDEEEDQTLYCLCRMKSHGDMIGCDNDECPYQWFHLSCVNLKPPLPDQWFCPDCLPKMKKRKR
uniref:PHD-type domain-containing protein n=2 Tax=Schizophyllum commune (strain H4-8 / FGSC 9210) TaxID=578458 RepID=D8QAV6_SCHCM